MRLSEEIRYLHDNPDIADEVKKLEDALRAVVAGVEGYKRIARDALINSEVDDTTAIICKLMDAGCMFFNSIEGNHRFEVGSKYIDGINHKILYQASTSTNKVTHNLTGFMGGKPFHTVVLLSESEGVFDLVKYPLGFVKKDGVLYVNAVKCGA